jgi:hypothetical protein
MRTAARANAAGMSTGRLLAGSDTHVTTGRQWGHGGCASSEDEVACG